MRILLHDIPGAKCYTDLRTTPDGVVHRTFKETAIGFGLLENDEEWDECLSEAAVSFMPKQLCSLFVTILIFGGPAKPAVLWDKYKDIMGEEFLNQSRCLQISEEQQRTQVTNEVLLFLQEELEGMGTCLEKFGLPTPDIENRIQRIPKVIAEEMFDVDTQ